MHNSVISASKDDNHCRKESDKFNNTNTHNDNSTLQAKALTCERESVNKSVK